MTKAAIPIVDDSAVVQTVLQRLDRLRERKATLLAERAAVPSGGVADRLTSEALANGGEFPDFTEARLRLDRHIDATAKATKTEEDRLTEARSKAALETRVGLSPRRRELLRTLDKALGQVLSAVAALEEFQDKCQLAGVSPLGAPWQFAGLSAPGLDINGMREALSTWRQEFAETQFTTEVAHYEQARANVA